MNHGNFFVVVGIVAGISAGLVYFLVGWWEAVPAMIAGLILLSISTIHFKLEEMESERS